jgi:hypothetical protein
MDPIEELRLLRGCNHIGFQHAVFLPSVRPSGKDDAKCIPKIRRYRRFELEIR